MEATLYGIAARALFAPFGGLSSIRRAAIDTLDLHPGARVLELGCGPGDVTALMLARGAVVHAVDASDDMLRVAAGRASAAHFTKADITTFHPSTTFDAVLLLFVLHEIPVTGIPQLLRTVVTSLVPGGRLVIADHVVPRGVAGDIWRHVLHAIESRTVDAWLATNPAQLLRDAGLAVAIDKPLAGGRVRLLAAERSAEPEAS